MNLAEVVADVIRFVDSLIDNEKPATTWIPTTREWH